MVISIPHNHRGDPWYSRKNNIKQQTVHIRIMFDATFFPNSLFMIQIIKWER